MFHEQAKYQKGRNLFLLSKLYRPTKPRRIPMNFNKSLLGILFIPFTMPRRHVHWHGLKWSLIGNAWDESPKAAKVNVFFFKKESAAQNMFSLDTQILHPQESNMSPKKGDHFKGKDRTPTTPPSFQWPKSSFRKKDVLHWKNLIWSREYPSSKLVEDTEKCCHLCEMFIPRSWSKMAHEKWSFTLGDILFIGHGFLATLKNHLCNPQQQKRNCNSNFFEGECLDGNKSNGKSRVTNNALLEGKSIKLPSIWAKL